MTEHANPTMPADHLGALDRRVLQELMEGLDDPDGQFVSGLAGVFERQAAELLAELEDAAHHADLPRVGRAAHSLKGSSATVGGTRLAAMCAALERWEGPTGELPARVVDIAAELAQLRRELGEYLPRHLAS